MKTIEEVNDFLDNIKLNDVQDEEFRFKLVKLFVKLNDILTILKLPKGLNNSENRKIHNGRKANE